MIHLPKYISKGWTTIITILVFWSSWSVFVGLFQKTLLPRLEKLEEYLDQFKKFPIIEKYGIDYAQPKYQDYGITEDD
jgi:hypothetical protein